MKDERLTGSLDGQGGDSSSFEEGTVNWFRTAIMAVAIFNVLVVLAALLRSTVRERRGERFGRRGRTGDDTASSSALSRRWLN